MNSVTANPMQYEHCKFGLEDQMEDRFPTTYWDYNDMTFSNKQLNYFFLGGEIKWYSKEEAGVYKSGAKKGQPKYKKEERSIVLPSLFDPIYLKKNKSGYSFDEDALRSIIENESGDGEIFATNMLTLREKEKELQMLTSLLNLTWPDGIIHPSYNHCITATGRLSCSNPNLQQVSK